MVKRLYRVEVTPEAYDIIEAEAYLTRHTIKSIASEILTKHCSEGALKIAKSRIKTSDDHVTVARRDQVTVKPEVSMIKTSDDHVTLARKDHTTTTPKDVKTIKSSDHKTVIVPPTRPADTRVLEFILSQHRAEKQPTPQQIADAVGSEARTIGRILGKLGVHSTTISRDKKTVRVYGLSEKEKIEKILGIK